MKRQVALIAGITCVLTLALAGDAMARRWRRSVPSHKVVYVRYPVTILAVGGVPYSPLLPTVTAPCAGRFGAMEVECASAPGSAAKITFLGTVGSFIVGSPSLANSEKQVRITIPYPFDAGAAFGLLVEGSGTFASDVSCLVTMSAICN